MNGIIFIISTMAFSLLSVTTGRNSRRILAQEPSQRSRLGITTLGWLLLLSSVLLALLQHGSVLGVVVWCLLATAALTVVVLLLSYRPHLLARLCQPLLALLD